ncbi:MAG: hypothetical protein IJI39_05275 [Clostridia bacterium]|nr:hypothetical protein [Clostridia bacterium]
MGLLKNCAEVYSRYSGYNYIFNLDCGISVTAAFKPQHFHHLIGLHYLTDIAQVNTKLPHNSAANVYNRILKNKISQEVVERSAFYPSICERMEHFTDLGEIISSKIIIDFDYTKAPNTKILSKYLLYKQYETAYAILGLKYDYKLDVYVPETFIVEHSDYYIKGQTTYNVVDVVIKAYR